MCKDSDLIDENRCATIDRVFKPSLLRKLKEAFEQIGEDGFGQITIEVKRGRPDLVTVTTSQVVRD